MIKYFDNAATTKIDEEVFKEMLPYLTLEYGNPSTLYSIGRRAKEAIEKSRNRVAKVLNCNSKEIYFTGGGSESDNAIIRGIAYANKNRGNHIITSKIEHLAVLETCRQLEKEGFEITYLNVDEKGFINLGELENSIKDNTILISIMFANNEIGTIQPIEKIGNIAKKYKIYFHTDAVQAVGTEKIDVKKLNLDALSLSGHKIYGPKGVGAMYIKNNVRFNKFINGGHQEYNKRAGTENLAGIVGLGKAIELIHKNFDEDNKKILKLRNLYVDNIEKSINNIKINGDRNKRLIGNSSISFKNINGDKLLAKLDEKDICVSTGSACNSTSDEPSHVLISIGLEKQFISGTLRVTIGKNNTEEEVEYLIKSLIKIINELRKEK